jgi:predicted dinucleotide-binding enzyme
VIHKIQRTVPFGKYEHQPIHEETAHEHYQHHWLRWHGCSRTGFVTPGDSFGAQEIAKAAPADANLVKAFNAQISHVLAAGSVEGRPLDVFLAGDDAQAKARVSAFIESLGLRPMDVGQLPMARTLEHACMLILGLITHSVKHTNFALGVSLLG